MNLMYVSQTSKKVLMQRAYCEQIWPNLKHKTIKIYFKAK